MKRELVLAGVMALISPKVKLNDWENYTLQELKDMEEEIGSHLKGDEMPTPSEGEASLEELQIWREQIRAFMEKKRREQEFILKLGEREQIIENDSPFYQERSSERTTYR